MEIKWEMSQMFGVAGFGCGNPLCSINSSNRAHHGDYFLYEYFDAWASKYRNTHTCEEFRLVGKRFWLSHGCGGGWCHYWRNNHGTCQWFPWSLPSFSNLYRRHGVWNCCDWFYAQSGIWHNGNVGGRHDDVYG